MKYVSVAAFSLFLSFTASAYSITNCSNASGSVAWNQGETDKINLAYTGFVPGVLELDLEQVSLETSNDQIISQAGARSCGAPSDHSVTYTMDVIVKPSEKSPNIFQSYFPKPEIKATVICERFSNERLNCSQD